MRGDLGPWAVAARLRNEVHDHLLRPARLEAPVISVGNLAFGGRGKTPFVRVLVERLKRMGRRPAVLTRGYGRRSAAAPLLALPELPASVIGDEPRMLALRDPDLLVVVDPDRRRGGAWAMARGADVLVLDDGFQHRRLHRDLDVVLLAPDDLEGRCPPFGALREPRAGLSRADFRALVSTELGGWPVARSTPEVPFDLVLRPRPLDLDGGPLDGLRGKAVALVSAIARPERFERLVEGLGARVVARRFFRDHAEIPAGAVRALRRRVDTVVTTEKDAARLGSRLEALGLRVLRIDLEIVTGEPYLRARLEAALSGRG